MGMKAIDGGTIQLGTEGGSVRLSPADFLDAIYFALDKRFIRLDQLPDGHAAIERAIDKLCALLQKPIRHYERDEQLLLQTARARLMEVQDLLVVEAHRRGTLASGALRDSGIL